MSPLDPTLPYYPKPSNTIRLAGISAILGAVLWPFSLILIGTAASTCSASGCSGDRESLGLAALAPMLLVVGIVGLELRARRELQLLDLIGDLSIGTSALLFGLAFILGTVGFVGPGLLLLLIGSVVFGFAGYRLGGRPRIPSILVAVGAGAFLFFLVGGAISPDAAGGTTPSIFSLLVYSAGWVWLGVDLLLARPLAMPFTPDPNDP